jgi:hypothetical protein
LLHFVPLDRWQVVDDISGVTIWQEGMIPMVQGIYREHGWPSLEQYRKRECLEAVNAALKKWYPDFALD